MTSHHDQLPGWKLERYLIQELPAEEMASIHRLVEGNPAQAARLEALAEPGGVAISSRVHDDVRDRLEAGFTDIGEQGLTEPIDAEAVIHCRNRGRQVALKGRISKPHMRVFINPS